MLKIYETTVEYRIQMDWQESDHGIEGIAKSGTISIGVWKDGGAINISATGSLSPEGIQTLEHCLNGLFRICCW